MRTLDEMRRRGGNARRENQEVADPQAQEKIGPIQKMRAQGFGAIEPHQTQDAQGMGAWQDGVWKIVISVPRRQEKFTFGEDTPAPLGFAVWDGSRDERNGQKAYSQWQNLQLGTAAAVAVQQTVTPVSPAPGATPGPTPGPAPARAAVAESWRRRWEASAGPSPWPSRR